MDKKEYKWLKKINLYGMIQPAVNNEAVSPDWLSGI